jgi:NO-binding membrane sensor protein with MHYT domain
MTGSLNHWLAGLSLLVAICASYAALDVAGRATAATGRARVTWLVGGAASMGLGIWSMHYIGMLAFDLPVAVDYHVPTVLVSLVAAVLASGVALVVASRARWSWPGSIAASIVMGGGIASMHYIGMEAMRLPATMRWNLWIVALSVVVAVGVSLVAMWLAFRFRSETREIAPLKIASAGVMGAAVVSMHYTGMAAATFLPSSAPVDLSGSVAITSLGLTGIMLVTLTVLVFASMTSVLDRRISAQSKSLRASEERYSRFFERSLSGEYARRPSARLQRGFREHSRVSVARGLYGDTDGGPPFPPRGTRHLLVEACEREEPPRVREQTEEQERRLDMDSRDGDATQW